MELEKRANLTDLLISLSRAIDLTGMEGGALFSRHGRQVSVAAGAIGQAVGLEEQERRDLLLASLVHDAGVSASREKALLGRFDVKNAHVHAEVGYRLLRRVQVLQEIATIVRHHHDEWAGPNKSGLQGSEIPLLSRIIHLADRACILIRDGEYVLHQREGVVGQIQRHSGTLFMPDLVAAFQNVAEKESFWLDLTRDSVEMGLQLQRMVPLWPLRVNDELLRQVASVFAQIVDKKSRFTRQHSVGVARVAVELGRRFLLSQDEQVMMEVAGMLHDLGKLALPDAILEKPGKLTDAERNVMSQHTYYTYHILAEVGGFEEIAEWAAFHHERLDGTGYPFRRDKTNLSLAAKTMCVSDVFQALHQDRPYRSRLPKETVLGILEEQVKGGALEEEIVEVVRKDYDSFARVAVPKVSAR